MANNKTQFSKDIIRIKDVPSVCNTIVEKLKKDVHHTLMRRGAVVGISGGIDSSVTAALSVKAFGADKVFGVMLPEKESSSDSADFAGILAAKLGIETVTENITGALQGFKCYERRDEAVRRVFPEYTPETHKVKIGISEKNLSQYLPPVFNVTIIDKNGVSQSENLHSDEFLQIVASSNFKQRSRMSMLYYHAERLHYAVIGTANKHEIDQGFFVKYGDGGADLFPIGKLYKTQVYQLAEYLGVPEEIINRTPTTDTYSAEQTQEEFFFQMPFEQMDQLWYAWENGYDPEEVGKVFGKTADEIEKLYNNFKRRKRTTEYLRMSPITDY
ncbi:MAG: NAD synthetase [Bacteroides sp. SM1_62]|nr:MAG: NAD synthetase [Bacteroides sp. SM23_62]KPL21988.1 MAG: NAD synthetase [Bacteroides sp. SM1_62]